MPGLKSSERSKIQLLLWFLTKMRRGILVEILEVTSSVADPVPLLPLDPGMNNPDHISESSETFFLFEILTFFENQKQKPTLFTSLSYYGKTPSNT
jgi:hypothetical protein